MCRTKEKIKVFLHKYKDAYVRTPAGELTIQLIRLVYKISNGVPAQDNAEKRPVPLRDGRRRASKALTIGSDVPYVRRLVLERRL